MQGYQPLSTAWHLAALGAAILASAIIMVAAVLPFALDSPERGQAIVAREARVRAINIGTVEVPRPEAVAALRTASNDITSEAR